MDPLRIDNIAVEEKPVKVEQPPLKEMKRGRKRKSQVRFSPSPTREETAHHADVEDNIAISDTPLTGRRRTSRPSKMLEMVNKTSLAKNMIVSELQPLRRGEDRSSKRKRSESLGNQSSDGAAETVEVSNDKKKSRPELFGKGGKVIGVRHSVTKEDTLGKSTNMKVSKSQPEDSPKTKSNVKQQALGENTQKVIGAIKHNTRYQHEANPSEPEVKRGKRHEPDDGLSRSIGRRSSSREIKSTNVGSAGEL